MAGFCETITSSASAKAEIEARAELGNEVPSLFELKDINMEPVTKRFTKWLSL